MTAFQTKRETHSTSSYYQFPAYFNYYPLSSYHYNVYEGYGAKGKETLGVSTTPWDMDTLKAALEKATPGIGAVKQIIKNCSLKLRAQAFTKLIINCGKFRQWEKAVEVFDAMKDYPGVKCNTYTYSALISACSNSGRLDEALYYFEEMKRDAVKDIGCSPNMITYRAIISTCERFGRFPQVLKLYNESLAAGIVPDKNTFAAAFDAAQHLGQCEKSALIIQDMHQNGVVASMVMYAALIKFYILNRTWQKAIDLIEEVEKINGGLQINKIISNGMKEPRSKPNQALLVLQCLWDAGIVIEIGSYNVILKEIAPVGWWQTSLKILKAMEDDHVFPNSETAEAVIEGALIAGEKSVARKLALKFSTLGIKKSNDDINEFSPRETRSC